MTEKAPNNPKFEGLKEKVLRISRAAKDTLVTVVGYAPYIYSTESDEEMRQTLKELFANKPIESYLDYLKKSHPETTIEEIELYFPQFSSKINYLHSRLTASDATRKELLDLIDDLMEHTNCDA